MDKVEFSQILFFHCEIKKKKKKKKKKIKIYKYWWNREFISENVAF